MSEVSTNFHSPRAYEDDFSDTSSFYGDSATKQRYQKKARQKSDHRRIQERNVQVVAAKALQREHQSLVTKKRKNNDSSENNLKRRRLNEGQNTARPVNQLSTVQRQHNIYEGNPAALQLGESVDDFLKRLVPSSGATGEPWIWCANFSAEHGEASDLASYRQIGTGLLDQYSAKRNELESIQPAKTAGTITRMLGPYRDKLREDIIQTARRYNVIAGKWMLFPTSDAVDRYWAKVVSATVEGRLGISAKVSTRPDNPDRPTQVICVYTRDFKEEADIKRVLVELVKLKLAPVVLGPLQKGASNVREQIWYKPDCYTYLDLMSGNEFKLKPTLYGTADLLTRADLEMT